MQTKGGAYQTEEDERRVENMFKRRKEKASEEDLKNRKVYLIETIFITVLEEEVSYQRWVRMSKFSNSLLDYKESELRDRTITTAEGKTYNTKHIVHMESKILKEGYVKEEVKREKGGYKWSDITPWTWSTYYHESQIEEVRDYVEPH